LEGIGGGQVVDRLGIAPGHAGHGGASQCRLQRHDRIRRLRGGGAVGTGEPKHPSYVLDVLAPDRGRAGIGLQVIVPVRQANPGLVDLGNGPFTPLGVGR
jgi:hypothetical protein